MSERVAVSTEPVDTDHPVGLDDRGLVHAQLLEQDGFGLRIEILLDLQLDHLPTAAALNGAAEGANEVFGLFLDLNIAIAQDPEKTIALDRESGEHFVRVALDQARDGDVDRLSLPANIAGNAHEARQGAGDQDHLDDLVLVGIAGEREEDPHALVLDERKRVRRVERLGSNDGQDFLEEERLEPFVRCRLYPVFVGDMDIDLGEPVVQVAPYILLQV